VSQSPHPAPPRPSARPPPLHRPPQVAVTASTGTAAINIGGQTIHSFAGVGLGEAPRERLALAAWRDDGIRSRWQGVQTLLLDEASMVSDELFDKVEYVARWAACACGVSGWSMAGWRGGAAAYALL
jgi:hypothetical protein